MESDGVWWRKWRMMCTRPLHLIVPDRLPMRVWLHTISGASIVERNRLVAAHAPNHPICMQYIQNDCQPTSSNSVRCELRTIHLTTLDSFFVFLLFLLLLLLFIWSISICARTDGRNVPERRRCRQKYYTFEEEVRRQRREDIKKWISENEWEPIKWHIYLLLI